jgi:hypothetical protein
MLVNRWRRALAAGGRAALASRRAGGAKCKLTAARVADQAWRRSGAEYTLAGSRRRLPGPEAAEGPHLGPPRHTPVVTVTGGHDTRVSLAALIAARPGDQARLIYRTHRGRRGDKRKGFAETDYARPPAPRTGSWTARSSWSGTT